LITTDSEKAKGYRQRAAEMIAMAEETKNPDRRHMLLSIAAMYHRLAQSMEGDED
jgi:ribosomal protein L17